MVKNQKLKISKIQNRVKSTLYITLNSNPWGVAQMLVHLALRIAIYEIHINVTKIRICTECPQTEIEHLTIKSTLIYA